MNQPDAKPLWKADEIAEMPESHIRHPWNPNSDIFMRRLSVGSGLSRVALTLARVPPGKESFIYHAHERHEEFLFILSGRGRAEIGEEVYDVGSGDFMGFPAPGVAHHLANPYDEDLVYLMGGERSGIEIGYYPKLGRRIMFTGKGIEAMTETDIQAMTFNDFVADPDEPVTP